MDIHSHFDYGLLTKVVNTQPPIRGTTNRYPVDERRYAHRKYFFVEEMDGETVYVVCFGYRGVARTVTQDEYTEMVKRGDKRRDRVYHTANGYEIREPVPHRLLIVRPDNTMEFCSESNYMHQGTIRVLNNWLPRGVWVNTDSQRGGMLITNFFNGYNGVAVHPIYKGLRVHIPDLKPHASSQYKWYKARVDRKKSKQAIAEPLSTIELGSTFLRAMDIEAIADSVDELCGMTAKFAKESTQENDRDEYWANMQLAYEKVSEAVKNDPVLYLLWLYMDRRNPFIYHVNFIYNADDKKRRLVNLIRTFFSSDVDVITEKAKMRLRKAVYSHENGSLYFDELLQGKNPPAGKWGNKVEVDGREVRQYL